jgi:hypothetical protein
LQEMQLPLDETESTLMERQMGQKWKLRNATR